MAVLTNRLRAEYRVFASCAPEMRLLLIANAIYAMVLPVIEIFVAAYVLHNSHRADRVLLYQLSIYVATPIAFLLNGYLLRIVPVNHLYAGGMCLSGGALVLLMGKGVHGLVGILSSGLLLGLASGIFWANRGVLALSTTTDDTRNYFYGIETSVMTFAAVSVPLAVGGLIETFQASKLFHDGANVAYNAIATTALLLTMASSAVMLLGRYKRPHVGRFLFLRFDPVWRRMLALAALRGLGQGYIVTAPALLILEMVGREGSVGLVESVGSGLGFVCLYLIGRISTPQQRTWVLAMGIGLFFTGAAMHAVLFNSGGVLIFMGCLLLAKPMIDLAYYPIQLRVVDVVSQIEGRSQYAYIFNHELGLFAGRLVGCVLFIILSASISDRVALRYSLVIVAFAQLPSVIVARRLPT